jgi:UDP-N-acetylglucosamine:LPS N-acetylglucosamine transferase
MADVMRASSVIICRPGYSTLMDLMVLGKKAIVIPTPGQTEQIYLGHYLHARKWFACFDQQGFHLETALHCLRDFSGPPPFEPQFFFNLRH